MTRTYYRVLDWAQPIWYRFRDTEVGRFTVWFMPQLWTAMVGIMIAAIGFAVALLVIGYGLLFVVILVITGNGKAIGSITKMITKIVVVVAGLLAAKKVVANQAAIIKALTKGP